MSGKFIISLDVELMWGGREKRTVDDYGDAILGGRQAIPAILSRFSKYDIHATWAVVGLLLAQNKEEMLEFCPDIKPQYHQSNLSPYDAIKSEVGQDEANDPYYYGKSLIENIGNTAGQEIACHSFSHFYCLEPGQTLEAFNADLSAFCAIAAHNGINVSSIIFPRNQVTDEHISILNSHGISIYRGTPENFMYNSENKWQNSILVRGLRLIDSAFPISYRNAFTVEKKTPDLINVPSSRFLRPMSNRLPLFNSLHLTRIKREMTKAAKAGKSYHLWWHPHNFGRNLELNLSQLEKILQHFSMLKEKYNFQSQTMIEAAKSAS